MFWFLLLSVALLIATALALLFALVLGVFFVFAAGHEEKELQRETSPDGSVDAVVWSVSGGGAAGYAYEYLYLTPTDEPAEEGKLALTPKEFPKGGFRLRWRDETTLEAGPSSAPNVVLGETYYPDEVRGEEYQVEWWAEPGRETPWDAESTP